MPKPLTAAEVVACVERLQSVRDELVDGLKRLPEWHTYMTRGEFSEYFAIQEAVAAAHEARRLLRWTREAPEEE